MSDADSLISQTIFPSLPLPTPKFPKESHRQALVSDKVTSTSTGEEAIWIEWDSPAMAAHASLFSFKEQLRFNMVKLYH